MSIEDVAQKIKAVSSTRTVAIIGIAVAILVPFSMIAFGGTEASNFPWYIWVLVPITLLVVVGSGYFLFTRSHDSEDISIRPKHR